MTRIRLTLVLAALVASALVAGGPVAASSGDEVEHANYEIDMGDPVDRLSADGATELSPGEQVEITEEDVDIEAIEQERVDSASVEVSTNPETTSDFEADVEAPETGDSFTVEFSEPENDD